MERTTQKVAHTYRARDVMRKMAESAWWCGDPGIQYDTTMNAWHTSKASGPINGSNPCAEYMYLDDTACNLSSLNLMTFRKGPNSEQFDVEAFKHASEVMITAMEILIGNSSYPTPAIEQNSLDYRPLGIGYANLGALLMSRGVPYDSDEGRNLAAAITSLMSGWTYRQSARIAEKIGPFAGFALNRESAIGVMNRHRDASYAIPKTGVPEEIWQAAAQSWDETWRLHRATGCVMRRLACLRRPGPSRFSWIARRPALSRTSLLSNTNGWSTVACGKTGQRHGSGRLCDSLGIRKSRLAPFSHTSCRRIPSKARHISKKSICPCLTARSKAKNGTRTIHYMGHVRMMAAVQPFLSGAISKTVNMPESATVEEIEHVYMEGWKLGLKAIAIYRDGSKRQQPLTTSIEQKQSGAKGALKEDKEIVQTIVKTHGSAGRASPRRRRLPDEPRPLRTSSR